jgi:hypothetical protein
MEVGPVIRNQEPSPPRTHDRTVFTVTEPPGVGVNSRFGTPAPSGASAAASSNVYTNSMRAILALSPERGPIFRIRV